MDAARQLAQLLESLGELVRGAVQKLRCLLWIRFQLGLGEPEGQGKRDQPLLRAVVEVPLQSPTLGVASLQETLA
jgi:hypothetical protein